MNEIYLIAMRYFCLNCDLCDLWDIWDKKENVETLHATSYASTHQMTKKSSDEKLEYLIR